MLDRFCGDLKNPAKLPYLSEAGSKLSSPYADFEARREKVTEARSVLIPKSRFEIWRFGVDLKKLRKQCKDKRCI